MCARSRTSSSSMSDRSTSSAASASIRWSLTFVPASAAFASAFSSSAMRDRSRSKWASRAPVRSTAHSSASARSRSMDARNSTASAAPSTPRTWFNCSSSPGAIAITAASSAGARVASAATCATSVLNTPGMRSISFRSGSTLKWCSFAASWNACSSAASNSWFSCTVCVCSRIRRSTCSVTSICPRRTRSLISRRSATSSASASLGSRRFRSRNRWFTLFNVSVNAVPSSIADCAVA